MFDNIDGPNGRDSGWCCCQRWYSVRRSKVRECCKYGGRTTALSLASRGSWTRRSHESRVTNEKSMFWRCSEAKASNLLIASRKVPALRTCSQVRVVKLARERSSLSACRTARKHSQARAGRERLTAKRGDGCIDGLYQNTLTGDLFQNVSLIQTSSLPKRFIPHHRSFHPTKSSQAQ